MTGMRAGYDRDALSLREREVLLLIATGMSNIAAGQKIWVTEQTIKHHMGNLMRKLGVKSRTEAVWRALELGLIDPPPRVDVAASECPCCGEPHV